METFSKLTNLLLQALETREPAVDLLSSFIDHWKSITNYYICTTDDSRPVRQTDIPWCLKQMLDILVYEEKQQAVEETGACLEYLLQHKLLETLVTLAKAQCPPGMCQQVSSFFSNVLTRMQKPLLHLVTVYRPAQKLIRLCALPGSQSEKEEAQFLLAVCSRVQQDPHMLQFVLEIPDQPAPRTPAPGQSQLGTEVPGSTHPPDPSGPVQSESSLLAALIELTNSQKPPVSLKAHEGLMLLSALQSPGDLHHAQLERLLTLKLVHLYSLLPLDQLVPGQLQNWDRTVWSSRFTDASGSDHVSNFFCWLDFLDQLMTGAPQTLSEGVAARLRGLWLLDVVQPQLRHTSEHVVLVSTSVLCALVRLARSRSLLDALVGFLLTTPTLNRLLLQRCDHVSEQISMVSLSLVDQLLQKPHREVLDLLVLGYLQRRSYLSPGAAAVLERGHSESHEPSEDLEDDPFFSDGLFSDSQLLPLAPPAPPCGPGSSADVINSFLCLVPVQVRSAHMLKDGGHESYVHDAHTLVTQCRSLSQAWDWPLALPAPAPSGEGEEFFEGHLFQVLFDRLGRILEQPYELNLLLTAVLSRLCSFHHPLLQEYLLDPYIHLSPGSRSLFSVLIRVMGEMMQRIHQMDRVTDRLVDTRRHLLGLEEDAGLDQLTLLRGVIVLEEFCKELAAIAFVQQS